ncbi:MAG TPA: electron transporter RnfD, partial [Desulfobacterales bacterium]|nr:electron transporter RnfD [Desulfobacterales bacterium]
TDTGSSPTNRWAMLLYGFIGGAITIVLRVWSTYPDGVVFAGLLASLFAPLLDKLRKRQEVPPSRPLKFL